MNDERFFDLAMKAIARQCTDAERAELDALLARQPELQAEFKRLQAEVRVAKKALPLVNATGATAGEFPAYARGRQQTKVRQTLGRPQPAESSRREQERGAFWMWRWVLGLATVTALVALIVVPQIFQPTTSIIQVAVLDVGGPTRSGTATEAELLRQNWPEVTVESFSDAASLQAWNTNWPGGKSRPVVKILFDRAAAELRVQGKTQRGTFDKTFSAEPDPAVALAQARAFIQEQLKQ